MVTWAGAATRASGSNLEARAERDSATMRIAPRNQPDGIAAAMGERKPAARADRCAGNDIVPMMLARLYAGGRDEACQGKGGKADLPAITGFKRCRGSEARRAVA